MTREECMKDFKTNHQISWKLYYSWLLTVNATCQWTATSATTASANRWRLEQTSCDVQHNTLSPMNVTDTNCLNSTLNTAYCHVQDQSKLAPYRLPWILIHSTPKWGNSVVTDINLSVCTHTHTQIFSSSGLLLPFERKEEDNGPFESGIKIAKHWWTSKYEH